MIRFACPGCSATFTVADEKAGKTGKCPKCQSQFVIPAADASAGADAPPPLPPPPAPAPSSRAPSPPSPADPNAPVEIQPCPKCSTRLSVLPTDIGVEIQCPSCETVFKALRADAPPPPETGSKKGSSSLVKLGSGSDRDKDDDDDRGSKRKSKRRSDDDDDDDRPSRRRSSRRDDDDDDDDRPSRRRRSRRRDDGYQQEDQATLVMIFTIIGGLMCWNIIGIGLNIASLIIASMNLKSIDNGMMVATNRGQISTCRTINIICLCLIPVLILGVCLLNVFAASAR